MSKAKSSQGQVGRRTAIEERRIGALLAKKWIRRMHIRPVRNIYHFCRAFEMELAFNPSEGTRFFSNASVTHAAASSFSLDDLPNATEFGNLFDSYRIDSVSMKWMFTATNNALSGVAYVSAMPLLYTVIDKDDGTPATTLEEMEQYQNLKVRRCEKPLKAYVRPRVAISVYKGAFTGYGQANKNFFVDMANQDIEYYGLKWAIDPNGCTTDAVVGQFKIIVKYYFTCKDVR